MPRELLVEFRCCHSSIRKRRLLALWENLIIIILCYYLFIIRHMVVDFLISSPPSTMMQHTPMFAYKVSRNNCVFSNSLLRREVLLSTLLCLSVWKLLLGAFICNYIKVWSSYLCTLTKYIKGISTPRRESHLQNNW